MSLDNMLTKDRRTYKSEFIASLDSLKASVSAVMFREDISTEIGTTSRQKSQLCHVEVVRTYATLVC